MVAWRRDKPLPLFRYLFPLSLIVIGVFAVVIPLHAVYAFTKIRAPEYTVYEWADVATQLSSFGLNASRTRSAATWDQRMPTVPFCCENDPPRLDAVWTFSVDFHIAMAKCSTSHNEPGAFRIEFSSSFFTDYPFFFCGNDNPFYHMRYTPLSGSPGMPHMAETRSLHIPVLRGTFVLFLVVLLTYLMTFCSRQSVHFQSIGQLFISRAWVKEWCVATEGYVLREAEKLRLGYSRRCVSALCPFLIIWFGSITLRINWKVTEYFRSEYASDLFGSELLPVGFASCVFLVLYCCLRHCQTSRPLDVANFMLSMMWIWSYCTFDRKFYDRQASTVWSARIMQGVILGNSRVSNFLHVVVTCSDILAHAAHKFSRHDMNEYGYVTAQVAILAMVAVLTSSFENLMISEAKALLEARRADKSSTLVYRLLGVLSDAVVHLDAEMRITKPSRHLAGLMLHHNGNGEFMLNRQFHTFLVADDQERFASFLEGEVKAQSSGSHDAPGRAIHVKMLSADSIPFAVEIFATFISSADSAPCFLVGIKEDTDEGRALPDHRGSPDLSLPVCFTQTHNDSTIDASRGFGDRSSLDQSSASSSDDVASGEFHQYFTAEPAFRFMHHEFTISRRLILLDYSPSFAAMFGPSIEAGFELSHWIADCDLDEFCEFSDVAIGHFADTSQRSIKEIGMEIRPRHLKASKLYMRAQVTIYPACGPHDAALLGDDDDDVPVLATLRNCIWRVGKSKGAHYKKKKKRPMLQSSGPSSGRIGTLSL